MTATMAQVRQTPLHAWHAQAGARMVLFAGWDMPVQYTSQIEEHIATREGCGLFDVSHMGVVIFEGPGALKFLRAAVTRDMGRLAIGEAAYGLLCNPRGGIIDDLIVSRLDEDRYAMVVNAAHYDQDAAEFEKIAERIGVAPGTVRPCSDDWAIIAVQGPKWIETLAPVIGEGAWRELPAFRAVEMTCGGAPMILSTTGYTGEAGCELLCAPGQAPALWSKLVEAGGRPVGLAARDTLRLEKGLWLAGQDFTEENTPYEAALGWAVDLDREDFQGREALGAIKAAGPAKKLVGLRPEGRRIPRTGTPVLDGGETVGAVTSGGFSPILNGPVALAYVAAASATMDRELALDLGRTPIPARVQRRNFLAR